MIPVDNAIELMKSAIEKSYGKEAIMKLGENAASDQVAAIPTGSLALDAALGVRSGVAPTRVHVSPRMAPLAKLPVFFALEGKRIDGRTTKEIRALSCEVGVLPRVHGSALFTRGETQGLVVTTLGTGEDEQYVDSLEGTYKQHFMLHYNFPPYSVGETGRMGSPGRREIGHGMLAERALVPVPANTTSSRSVRRKRPLPCSPSAQRMASAKFDLPEPFGPTIAKVSPFSTAKDKPSKICK